MICIPLNHKQRFQAAVGILRFFMAYEKLQPDFTAADHSISQQPSSREAFKSYKPTTEQQQELFER